MKSPRIRPVSSTAQAQPARGVVEEHQKTGSMPSPPPYKFFDYIFLFISIVPGLTFFVLHYLGGKGTLFSAAVAFCIWMPSVLLEVFIPNFSGWLEPLRGVANDLRRARIETEGFT